MLRRLDSGLSQARRVSELGWIGGRRGRGKGVLKLFGCLVYIIAIVTCLRSAISLSHDGHPNVPFYLDTDTIISPTVRSLMVRWGLPSSCKLSIIVFLKVASLVLLEAKSRKKNIDRLMRFKSVILFPFWEGFTCLRGPLIILPM